MITETAHDDNFLLINCHNITFLNYFKPNNFFKKTAYTTYDTRLLFYSIVNNKCKISFNTWTDMFLAYRQQINIDINF